MGMWELVRQTPVVKLQRQLGRALRSVERGGWVLRGPVEGRARLHTCSGWGAGAAILRCPTEQALQVPDADLRVAVCERLGVPRCSDVCCAVRFRSGRVCGQMLRGGWHAHCCPGLAGCRTRSRHNPLSKEWAHLLTLAGRFAVVEQRDPMMGPNSRLDVVEFASAQGGPAAYDVSVVTPFRADGRFVQECARVPGLAAARRHEEKLESQYPFRVPGSRLIPLVVETGGRWHPSVPRLVRGLAREFVGRTPGLPAWATGAVVSRWAARLSALVIRGNAAAVRGVLPPWAVVPGGEGISSVLPHSTPEGDSAYELLVH